MRPFGYETDRHTVRPDEAELIRTAVRKLIDGYSLRAVAEDWNSAGKRTPGGNNWQYGTVRRVLRSQRITGRRQRSDGELVDAGWPAIVDPETHAKMVAQLDVAKPGAEGPATSRTYLLTGGIAKCGLCSSDLLSKAVVPGKRGYACVSSSPTYGCGKIRINGELLDDEVATRVIARLIQPKTRDRIELLIADVRNQAELAEERIDQAKTRLAEIGEEYARGSIVAATLKSATNSLNREISEARRVQRTAAALDNIAVLEARNLIEWWEGASLEQQRTLLSILVRDVVVMPAPVRGSKKFAPERVKVRWK